MGHKKEGGIHVGMRALRRIRIPVFQSAVAVDQRRCFVATTTVEVVALQKNLRRESGKK